jgi:hypothetical protein
MKMNREREGWKDKMEARETYTKVGCKLRRNAEKQ